jgi:DNA repair ATPase RecN
MEIRTVEAQSEAMTLQQENEKLRAVAQQAGEMDALRAEVQRLQHLEQDFDQFNADVEAFCHLQADVRDLDVFRRNKAAILHYMKLFPGVVE